ncbi:MAG: tail fiber domain-containing protein [Planctomycetes bacterium]|nr:tail fiber domain-containing protein [Planctomycetota bacterium]
MVAFVDRLVRSCRSASLCAALFLAFAVPSQAQGIPEQMNVAGVLSDSAGERIVSTTKTFTFALYDTFTGGVALWSESASLALDAGGGYQHALGSRTLFPTTFNWNQALYLGITVAPDQEMIPRVNLLPAPSALNAARVGGIPASATPTANNLLTLDSSARVPVAALPTILPAQGGTGLTSFAAGDLLYATGGATFARLAAGTAGQMLTSGGAGAPSWTTPAAAANDLHAYSWTNVDATDLKVGSITQGYNAGLASIAALAKSDGNFIVGDGATWVAESGATARTSLGLGNVENTALTTWAGSTNITTLGTVATGTWNGTTIALANGGTGATTAAAARTALGLVIGTDVQAYNANLADFIDLNVDSDTFVIDTANDRVGIGTSSPAGKLQINGGVSGGVGDYLSLRRDTTDWRMWVSDGTTGTPSLRIGGAAAGAYAWQFDWTGAVANIFRSPNGVVSQIALAARGAAGQTANIFEVQNSAGSGLVAVNSAGSVGIGTISPGSALDVKGTLRLSGSTSGYVGLAPAAVAGTITYTLPTADGTSGQALQTNGAGTLSWGIGINSDGQIKKGNPTINPGETDAGFYSDDNTFWVRFVTNNAPFNWFTDGDYGTNTKMILSTTGVLTLEGGVRPESDNAVSCGSVGLRWTEVYAVNGAIQTSDARAKDHIAGLSYGLDDVLKLRPVSFSWKDHPEQGTKIGLIAQEMREVIPELVHADAENPDAMLGVNYAELTPVLIRAVQEQQARIATLETRLQSLEAGLRERNRGAK